MSTFGIADELDLGEELLAAPSDESIARAARHALLWNIEVPESRIGVLVDDGVVELTGSVDWDYQRRIAEAAVNHLRGVKAVNNLVTVTREL